MKLYALSICQSASFLATILFIKKIVSIISIIIPVILVFLVTIDILKAVMASDDSEIKKAQNLAIKRIIYALLIFFVPIIINGVFNLLGESGVDGLTCYSNAADEVVNALSQAEREQLLVYEENINQLIQAAKKGKEARDKEIQRLRQIAANISQDSNNQNSNNQNSNNSTALQKWFNALEEEYRWAKNSAYGWTNHPSTDNSRIRSTCATYVIVSMQRAKLIPKGRTILEEKNGKYYINSYGKRYIKKHSDLLSYSYVNSTPKQLYKSGELKPGDIVTFKFKPSGHTMVFVGTNKNGKLLWDTGGSTRCVNCKMNSYLNRTVNIIIRVKNVGG